MGSGHQQPLSKDLRYFCGLSFSLNLEPGNNDRAWLQNLVRFLSVINVGFAFRWLLAFSADESAESQGQIPCVNSQLTLGVRLGCQLSVTQTSFPTQVPVMGSLRLLHNGLLDTPHGQAHVCAVPQRMRLLNSL